MSGISLVDQIMFPSRSTFPSRWSLVLSAAASFLLTGCFEAKYEERLSQTVAYFRHQEMLNAAVGPQWSGNGISIRPPRQFTLISLPTEGGAEGESKPARKLVDPRQPDYLGMELPGLLAAWKGQVAVDGQEVSAFMYLLSNHGILSMPAGPNRPKPEEFAKKTTDDLAKAAKLTIQPGDWLAEKFPKKSDYFPQVSYESVVLESPREVAGQRMRYSIYQRIEGEVQALVLFVIPSKTSDPIADGIPWSLETMQITNLGSASTSGAQPASSSGGASF